MTTPAGAGGASGGGGEGHTSSPTQPLQFNTAPAGLSSWRRPRVDSSTASSSNAHDAGSSSTTSHASTASSRLPSSSALNHGSSNPATPRSALSSIPPPASPMHQPLSLADALARSQGDITRALDEVLAERNKHCLEAAKLSNENIRIWNLMGKIRKENESLKAKLLGGNNNGGGGSSAWSNSSSSVEGGATTPLSASTMRTPQRSVTSPLAAAGAANASAPSSRNRLPSADAAVAATPAAAPAPAASSMTSPRRAPLPPLLPASQSHSPYAAASPAGGATTSSSSSAGTPQPPPAIFTSSASVPNNLSNDSSILDLTEQAPLPPNEAAQTPLSPGARNVMAQRERAKALQQQQARAGPSSAGMAMARSLSSGLAGAGSSSSQQHPPDHLPRPSEDYTAVDSSTVGGGASDDDAFSKGAASSSSATPTKSALGLLHQPRGSVGSVDTADSDDIPARPVRRKNFGADAPPALRPRPSRLEPRDATTSRRKGGDDDSGDSGDAGGSGMSLSQALMQLANSTPPGGSPNLSQPQPRLDNRLLKHANVRVAGSNLRHDERRREIPTFYLAVDLTDVALSNPTALPLDAPTSWRIEKSMNDVLGLDAKLRHRGGKAVAKKIGAVPLPEKQLFKDHAPSKVDMRKSMLDAWFLNLLAVQLPDKDDVCTFLCTDVVAAPRGGKSGRGKDGWLTKKGQNLGRWVTRYYALDGPRLDYFESKEGGALLGSIHIRGAQIGRQQRAAQGDMDENSYRHAFLILEKKKGVAPGAMGPNGEAQPNERINAGGAPVPDQLVRHVLCAESDDERDEWVDALVKTIAEIERSEGGGATGGGAAAGAATVVPTMSTSTSGASAKAPAPALPPSGSASSSTSAPAATKTKRSNSLSRRLNKSRDGGAAAAAAAAAVASDDGPASPSSSPAVGGSADADPAALSSPSLKDRGVRPAISAPMNGTPIPTGYKFGARDDDTSRPGPVPTGSLSHSNSGSSQQHYQTTSQQQATQQSQQQQAAQQPSDRRRFWHRFGGGGVGSSGTTGDLAGLAKGSSSSLSSHHNAGTTSGPVFGVPLTDAIAISSVGSGLLLPSVVFRCIEYLEKRQAIQEEGIYRMSGSTADVKALRDRFNNEGDVDLLAGGGDKDDDAPHHDPHAVAGLLKTFLRELPTSVLTRELHLDFMRVNDVADWKQRVRDLGHLVSALPLANYSLLRTLCAHLIKVISYQDVNKMTMRNVGIVFSPTLGIPAGVFALFLTSFDYCFWTDAKGEPKPRDPTMEDDQDGEGGEGGTGGGGGGAQATSSSRAAAGAGGEGAGASLPPPSPAAADQRGSTDTPSGTSRSNSASGSGSGSGSGSASGSSSYGYGFPPGAVPPHPYRASSIGYRSTPNAAQAAAIAANAAQAAAAGAGQQPQPQPQSQPGRWQQRSNRNSLNYSEEDARRLLGGVPLGTHRLRRTNPEDEGSYDAEEDFMGGPTVAAGAGGGGLSAPPSANSSRRPSPAGLQGGGGGQGGENHAAGPATNASPGRWTQVGAS